MDLLILSIDSLSLLIALSSKTVGLGIEVIYCLIECSNMNILLVKFLTQSLELCILLLQLLLQALDGLLQLSTLQGTVGKLLLELGNEFTVLLHTVSNELDVFLELLLLVDTLAILSKTNAMLSLTNLLETFLDFVQGTHQIVNFTVFLCNNAIKRICLSSVLSSRIILAVVTTSQTKCCYACY